MSTFSKISLPVQDEQATEELSGLSRFASKWNRRNFLATMGLTAGAAGMAGMAGCSNDGAVPVTASDNTNPPPVDVLNFALNLEYLEASFYSYVATGNGISSTSLGTGAGAVSGFAKVNFTNSFVATLAANLAQEELEHVNFLRATIAAVGGTPVSAPALNLAALGAPTSDATFLALARALETVGVSAYAGGAQFLVSNTAGLTYAAQILDVEAQHEGALRQACIQLGVTSPAVDSMDMPPTATQIFNTGATTGLNPVRTISQVLQIVYATPGVTGTFSGGFFPSGLNGNIHIT